MGLESATYVDDLNSANPASGDNVSQGDDHLRLVKAALQGTFPFASKPFRFPTGTAISSTPTNLASTDDNEFLVVDATSATMVVNLPTLTSAQAGWSIRVIKIDSGSNEVNITPDSGTINGSSTYDLRKQYDSCKIEWTGSVYVAISRSIVLANDIEDAVITVGKLASGAYASQAQAEAGTENTLLMTALRVSQAIAALGEGFASSTGMLFYQASAPTGWTAVAVNDHALRVVSAGGTGGSAGGTNSFSSKFNSTVTTSTESSSVQPNDDEGVQVNAADDDHTHTFNLDVKYADVIICTKD